MWLVVVQLLLAVASCVFVQHQDSARAGLAEPQRTPAPALSVADSMASQPLGDDGRPADCADWYSGSASDSPDRKYWLTWSDSVGANGAVGDAARVDGLPTALDDALWNPVAADDLHPVGSLSCAVWIRLSALRH